MKIGIIGSSGGSTFAEMADIAGGDFEFRVITDRPCGMESICESRAIPFTRHPFENQRQFSKFAAESFADWGAQAVLLFYSRLVGSQLYRRIPTYNVHPSLLPAFNGFGAVEQAKKLRVRFFGATLHLVDESVDAGPIVAQVCAPMDPESSIERFRKVSFIQKVYLSLVFLEHVGRMARGENATYLANPSLNSPGWVAGVNALEARENCFVFSDPQSSAKEKRYGSY